MANSFSFDIVSEIDLQEVDNAVNQALKEVQQRYDLKDSNSTIELNRKDKLIKVGSKDEFSLRSVNDILQNKLIKRGISIKALVYEEIEAGTMGSARQTVKLQQGIEKENAKKIVKMIKDSKLKVQASIQDEQVRVTGKSKDDLQDVMNLMRNGDLDFAFQFTNYR